MAIDDATNSRIGEGSAHRCRHGGRGRGAAALGIAANVLPVIGPAVAGGILMSVSPAPAARRWPGRSSAASSGWAIPEDDATAYEGEVRAGSTLVTVRAETREMEAWQILSATTRTSARTPSFGSRVIVVPRV